MAVATPDWLTKHGGDVRASKDQRRYVVYFAKEPQYVVEVVPVSGKFGTRVMQTINGRRVESNNVFPSMEEAVAGGLEDLRKHLGW
jgi:hypothetical protein